METNTSATLDLQTWTNSQQGFNKVKVMKKGIRQISHMSRILSKYPHIDKLVDKELFETWSMQTH
jgi:hypothetical protein